MWYGQVKSGMGTVYIRMVWHSNYSKSLQLRWTFWWSVTGDVAENTFSQVPISSCTCSAYTLTYECTVISGSGGSTIWQGTAFNCVGSTNEIDLLHNRFESDRNILKTCNNKTIVVQGLRIDGNCYTSQLNVTVSPNKIGDTIECAHDNNGTTDTIGFSIIPNTTG